MRILALLLLLLSSGTFVSSTVAASAPDRPPGVDADHWIALGESIGVVLTTGEGATRTGNAGSHSGPPPSVMPVDRTALLAPTRPFVLRAVEHAEAREPVQGYLMMKQGGTWRRLLLTSP